MNLVTEVQILDKVVCINVFEKGMNLSFLPITMGDVIEWTRLISFSVATSLNVGKLIPNQLYST